MAFNEYGHQMAIKFHVTLIVKTCDVLNSGITCLVANGVHEHVRDTSPGSDLDPGFLDECKFTLLFQTLRAYRPVIAFPSLNIRVLHSPRITSKMLLQIIYLL
jgi:hypothetical protein